MTSLGVVASALRFDGAAHSRDGRCRCPTLSDWILARTCSEFDESKTSYPKAEPSSERKHRSEKPSQAVDDGMVEGDSIWKEVSVWA